MGSDKKSIVKPRQVLSGKGPKTAGKAKVPLSWRVWAWIGHVILAAAIFAAFYHTQATGVQSNPYHPFDAQETIAFGFLFGVLGSLVIKYLIVDKVLLRTAQKRPAMEIAEEVARDVAITGAETIAETVIDAAAGSSSGSSGGRSSGGGASGGGGKYGGGGASGDY